MILPFRQRAPGRRLEFTDLLGGGSLIRRPRPRARQERQQHQERDHDKGKRDGAGEQRHAPGSQALVDRRRGGGRRGAGRLFSGGGRASGGGAAGGGAGG